MKVSYRKLSEFRILGLKIFEFKTDYVERSMDNDDDDNEFFISLTHRILQDKE